MHMQRWFQKFRHDEFNLDDKEDDGRCSGIDNDELKALVEANLRTTIRELARELVVSIGTISEHLNRIGKSKRLDKWVPQNFNENQKNSGYEVCFALLLRNKNVLFSYHIVTCDEK